MLLFSQNIFNLNWFMDSLVFILLYKILYLLEYLGS